MFQVEDYMVITKYWDNITSLCIYPNYLVWVFSFLRHSLTHDYSPFESHTVLSAIG